MKHQSDMLPGRFLSLLLGALFILAAASAINAQSGRKIPKRQPNSDPPLSAPSEPPVAPPAEPRPTEQKPADQSNKEAIPVLVAKYKPNINSSTIYTNLVIDGFMARMASVKAVKAQAGNRELNRKQASDAAKASANTYVVWIELLVDTVDTEHAQSSIGYVNPNYLYVDYVVFAPGTGKSKTSGHVYQRRGRIGGVNLPGQTPGTVGAAEYALRRAGEETADRVLDTLDLLAPPVIRH